MWIASRKALRGREQRDEPDWYFAVTPSQQVIPAFGERMRNRILGTQN
jgi:hypothetical protein